MAAPCLMPPAAPNSTRPDRAPRNRAKYEYDARGLITEVHSPAGWTYYDYDARGAMTTKVLPNTTVTYHTYDAAGRITKLENLKSDATPICTFEFTRDTNGNILSSLREDDSCWYYEYDGLQRLTAAEWKDSGGASLYAYQYDYDRVGNRSHLLSNGSHTYYAYNAANELTIEETPGVETAYYTYDGRGNQARREVVDGHTTYFDYNSRNLITRIDSTDPAFTTPNTFAYNALGQRVRITHSTGTTYYVWDGIRITHEHDGSGTVTKRYTYGHAEIEGVSDLLHLHHLDGDTNPHYWYEFDQVGGVRRLTDASGSAAQAYEYSPFGRILADTGVAPRDFVFPANAIRLHDADDVCLSFLRPYLAGAGRWISNDRVRLVNRYQFGHGDPLGYVDPDSRDPVLLNLTDPFTWWMARRSGWVTPELSRYSVPPEYRKQPWLYPTPAEQMRFEVWSWQLLEGAGDRGAGDRRAHMPHRARDIDVVDWYEKMQWWDPYDAYHLYWAATHPGAIKARSVHDMVKEVRSRVGEHGCIRRLSILGHGAPGSVSIGAGKKFDKLEELGDNIDPRRAKDDRIIKLLRDELAPLFCANALVEIRGCYVASGVEGQRFIQLLANLLQVRVRAMSNWLGPVPHHFRTAMPNRRAPELPKGRPKRASGGWNIRTEEILGVCP